MINNIDEVIEYRKKLFSSKKYSKYSNVINQMIIPESFDYKDCIPKIFFSDDYSKINKYEIEPYKSFYNYLKKDIIKYQGDIDKRDVLLIIHPFYPLIRHANILISDNDYFIKYKEYESKIIDLLEHSDKDIILFESPDSFACFSHLFLKYNRIKKVILTEHSHGYILDKKDLSCLDKCNKVTVAGCYKDYCVDEVLKELNIKDVEFLEECIMKRSNLLKKSNSLSDRINYDNCLTNLSCSILNHYGVIPKHNTLKSFDNIINKKRYKNVVLILCDGLGYNILLNNLRKNSFLVNNIIMPIYSVVPPTTTSATASVLSGLNPCEHLWLGWDIYIKNEDKIVQMFSNNIKDTTIQADKENLAKKYFDYNDIFSMISKSGYKTKKIVPFGKNPYKDIDDMFNIIIDECKDNSEKFIYAYCTEPDTSLHNYGTCDKRVKHIIKMLNDKIKYLSNNISDSLIIVIADHGHKDSDDYIIEEYPEIKELLDKDIWLEGRFCSFSVKKKHHKKFEELFNKLFSHDFILKTKKEVLDEELFGDGEVDKRINDVLGDYIAIAIGDKYFRNSSISYKHVSNHAGLTEDEMIVPLIVIER